MFVMSMADSRKITYLQWRFTGNVNRIESDIFFFFPSNKLTNFDYVYFEDVTLAVILLMFNSLNTVTRC